jgi:hypothetical protein
MAAKIFFKSKIRTKALNKVSRETSDKAREKIALSMLEWMVSGSQKESKTAPIRRGILRASASVFVGNKLIAISTHKPKEGTATPNKSHSGKRGHVEIGFNTPYAKKMHEDKLQPGPFSKQSGNSNPGNQWVLAHLKKDGPDLMKVAALIYKKNF